MIVHDRSMDTQLQKQLIPKAYLFGMLPPEERRWAHTRFVKLFPIHNMGVTSQKFPTPEVYQQHPEVPTKIPTPQINTAGIPVYHLYA